jgi:hypothetical protein
MHELHVLETHEIPQVIPARDSFQPKEVVPDLADPPTDFSLIALGDVGQMNQDDPPALPLLLQLE